MTEQAEKTRGGAETRRQERLAKALPKNQERLAKALRENIARRKAQIRARDPASLSAAQGKPEPASSAGKNK